MILKANDPKIVTLLKAGAVGVMPTDTVYGLLCDASNKAAVAKLYGLKKRENKPGTLIAASVSQFVDLGLKNLYLKAVEQYWPGSISAVIPTQSLEYLHLGVDGLACRVIKEPEELLNVLNDVGPMLSSSCNHPREEPASNIRIAQEYFGDTVDFYVDGGDLSGQKPSTLIRVVDDAVEVLREGAVRIDEKTGEIIA